MLIALRARLHTGRSMARTLLLSLALIGAVIFGLLAMHSMNAHALGAHADDSTAVLAVADPSAHTGGHLPPAGAAEPECAECGAGDASMMAVGCILALLVTLLLLARPMRPMSGRPWLLSASARGVSRVVRIESRPPSLAVLCISRT